MARNGENSVVVIIAMLYDARIAFFSDYYFHYSKSRENAESKPADVKEKKTMSHHFRLTDLKEKFLNRKNSFHKTNFVTKGRLQSKYYLGSNNMIQNLKIFPPGYSENTVLKNDKTTFHHEGVNSNKLSSRPEIASYYAVPLNDIKEAYRRAYYDDLDETFGSSFGSNTIKLVPKRLAFELISKLHSRKKTVVKLYPVRTKTSGDKYEMKRSFIKTKEKRTKAKKLSAKLSNHKQYENAGINKFKDEVADLSHNLTPSSKKIKFSTSNSSRDQVKNKELTQEGKTSVSLLPVIKFGKALFLVNPKAIVHSTTDSGGHRVIKLSIPINRVSNNELPVKSFKARLRCMMGNCGPCCPGSLTGPGPVCFPRPQCCPGKT